MSDPNLNLGIGGGTPPLGGGPSLDDDEKALKKGNTGVLVAGVLAGLVAVGGLIALLASEGDDQYGTIGRQINGMKSANFDSFWACALPNEPLDGLRSDRDLRQAIHERASGAPARYAQHVRQRCMQKLDEHEQPLADLIAPQDLQGQLDQLETALTSLRAGWDGYLEYLDHAEDYDEEQVAPHINKIAKGWYDYRHTHSALNTSIREHLEQ